VDEPATVVQTQANLFDETSERQEHLVPCGARGETIDGFGHVLLHRRVCHGLIRAVVRN
jgi:hypothetical protein